MCLSKVLKDLLLKLMLLRLITNPAWYPDTGATNHITSDFGNLTLGMKEYRGFDQVHVGNGQGLPIHHIGSSYISSPSYYFVLSNILHVPKSCKQLLSVNQFTKDNHVSIDFHPSYFYVKDLAIGTILLCGLLKECLFQCWCCL